MIFRRAYWKQIAAAATLLAWCAESTAATVALRQQAYASGAVILLGDLADVSAANDFQRDALITAPLMPVPAAGARLFLTKDDIRTRLLASGVDTRNLRFTGALRVSINGGRSETAGGSAPREQPVESVRDAIIEEVRRDLATRTGFDRWRVELAGQEKSLAKIGALARPLVVTGPVPPRPGRLSYRVSSPESGDQVQLYVRADRSYDVLVAVRPIRQGDVVRAADVATIETDRRPSARALVDTNDAVGLEATRSIPEGTMVVQSSLRAPLLVHRGDVVPVVARAGTILVRTTGVAQQDGAMGELVKVETADGESAFVARVSGYRKLEVLATGARAAEYAGLRDERERLR
ncbi:MAG: flagellar basal body P-ring formation chaperone FlgA [Planctomycetota bacterium]